jgi:ubiquinone/menaquinone biosynthesis C-methylase UbiE
MRAMDIGPGMGFFSLPMARMVGPQGRVICVDVQPKMLDALLRRARRANLADRIETRTADALSLGGADLTGTIDFVLAFAVVHETGDAAGFFKEVHRVLKPGGRALFAEPPGHVSQGAFEASVRAAEAGGLVRTAGQKVARSHATLLEKR